MDQISKFFIIKPHTKFGILLYDYLNNRSYELDKNLQKYFSEAIAKKKLPKIGGKKELEKLITKNSDFWEKFNNKESLIYHLGGYNYPFLEYEDPKAFEIDSFMMKKFGLKRELPSPFKEYKLKQIDLEKGEKYSKVSVEGVSQSKKIENEEDSKVIFGQFSYASFGNILFDKPLTKMIRKTVPSGGNKHPTEIYIIFPRNSIYKEGVYHYNVKEHKLDVITDGDVWDDFIKATNYSFKPNAKFGVVFTSMVERAMFRYRDIRSTRAIFGDLGHILQNTRYVGCALGFVSITEIKNNEEHLKEILKITNTIEPILATQAYY